MDAQHLLGTARQRFRLHPGRSRPRRHQLPRPGGCQRGNGAPLRRAGLQGESGRGQPRPRYRRAAHRSRQQAPAAGARGHERRSQGGAEGIRDRQPLRPGLDAHHRHRLGARPLAAVRRWRHDRPPDPDRRGDQPGQLGRPAARLGRPPDRRQHDDLQPLGGIGRHRVCGAGGHGEPRGASSSAAADTSGRPWVSKSTRDSTSASRPP